MKTYPLSIAYNLPRRSHAGEGVRAKTAFRRVAGDFLKPGPRRLSLGIAVFCLAMIAMVWVVISARAESERARVLQDEMRQNVNLAIAFEQYSLRILRNVEAVTQFVESAYLRRNRETDLSTLLAERVAANDFLEVIAIVDAQGRLLATSQQGRQTGVIVANRAEFRAQESGAGAKMHVGRTGITPLWNEVAIPITRRISLADGSFGGVVIVLVRPNRFTDFHEGAEVQGGDTFMLLGLDGIVRSSEIGGRDTFGENLGDSALLKQRALQANDTYEGTGHPDGLMRLQAYRTLPKYPLVVVVSSLDTEVLGGYSHRRSLYYGGAVAASFSILLFAVVVLVAVFRVARTTNALAESEARFRSLTEVSADWWWEQNAEFRFVDIGGLAATHGNVSVDEFLGRRRWEMSNLKPLNTTWEIHREVLAARLPFGDLLLEYTDHEGEVHFESISGRPIFNAEGNFRGYRGAGTDVTAQIETARALQESETRFRHLAELSSDWYWEQDDQFRYTFMSKAHQRHIAVENDRRIGKTRWDVGLQGLTEAQWAEHRRQLNSHLPYRNLEYHRTVEDGSVLHISSSGDPVFDGTGRFTGYRGTASDITQRKLVEAEMLALNATLEEHVLHRTAQLESANHELRALGYSIAHDMRAPLRAIGGFSTMLRDCHLPQVNAEGRALFSRIQTNVDWMGQLIEGLLELSHLSTALVNKESIDFSTLAREIVDEMHRLEPSRNVDVVIADGMVIEGDRIMMKRMLQNLIGNAWKYTSQVPLATIEIGVMKDLNEAPIYFIKDNGAGFDMKYASKLFQAFQRLHSPAEFPGTGIGLAIVSRIIGKHGGRIRADSTVGKGAAFHFTLRR